MLKFFATQTNKKKQKVFTIFVARIKIQKSKVKNKIFAIKFFAKTTIVNRNKNNNKKIAFFVFKTIFKSIITRIKFVKKNIYDFKNNDNNNVVKKLFRNRNNFFIIFMFAN